MFSDVWSENAALFMEKSIIRIKPSMALMDLTLTVQHLLIQIKWIPYWNVPDKSTYKIFATFSILDDHTNKEWQSYSVVMLSIMGRKYKATVSWSDLFCFCGKAGKKIVMSYGTQRNPPHHAPFFLSITFIRFKKWRFPQDHQSIHSCIVVLWDDYIMKQTFISYSFGLQIGK